MKVLVTGGAGYIGSHVARLLSQRGDEVIIIDDLSTGLRKRSDVEIIQHGLGESSSVEELVSIFELHKPEAVIHLAARKQVGESVQQPEAYYLSNVAGMAQLLLAMKHTGVKNLIFSSSAATYGTPDLDQVTEDTIARPINPYGETKLVGEWMAKNAQTWGLRSISLRYFNVAGAGWPDLADTAALNLIPIVLENLAQSESPTVFGDDYKTQDGSCIRDYVHVMDLATAHLAALDELGKNEEIKQPVLNVGTGAGTSVFEVLDEIKRVSGIDFETRVHPRRPGDPARLVADVSLIEKTLGWKAEFGLREIIESSFEAKK